MSEPIAKTRTSMEAHCHKASEPVLKGRGELDDFQQMEQLVQESQESAPKHNFKNEFPTTNEDFKTTEPTISKSDLKDITLLFERIKDFHKDPKQRKSM